MSEILNPSELRLKDPLSEVTRNERKALIAASGIVIAISKTGLIPTKISALGIEFGSSDQNALLFVLQLIIIYFIVAFIIYSLSDYTLYREILHNSICDYVVRQSENKLDKNVERDLGILENMHRSWWRVSWPIPFIRGFFEFIVPLLIAFYALYSLGLAKQKIVKTTSNSQIHSSGSIGPIPPTSSKP
jgi:hypothetical protein